MATEAMATEVLKEGYMRKEGGSVASFGRLIEDSMTRI